MLRITDEKSWCSVGQIKCTATVLLPYSYAVSKFVLNAKVVHAKLLRQYTIQCLFLCSQMFERNCHICTYYAACQCEKWVSQFSISQLTAELLRLETFRIFLFFFGDKKQKTKNKKKHQTLYPLFGCSAARAVGDVIWLSFTPPHSTTRFHFYSSVQMRCGEHSQWLLGPVFHHLPNIWSVV